MHHICGMFSMDLRLGWPTGPAGSVDDFPPKLSLLHRLWWMFPQVRP